MKKVSYQGGDFLLTADANGVISCWDILEFVKGVDQISQDYHLEGLKPLSSVKTNQRVICIEVAQQEQEVHPEEQVEAKNDEEDQAYEEEEQSE